MTNNTEAREQQEMAPQQDTARQEVERHFMQDWADVLTAELGLDCEAAESPNLKALLDITRLIAHNVTRPAGPVATYYIGLAAGLAAGKLESAEEATTLINKLVDQHIATKGAGLDAKIDSNDEKNTEAEEDN